MIVYVERTTVIGRFDLVYDLNHHIYKKTREKRRESGAQGK